MKHVGTHGNKPCLIVFREVPDEPENCLIVETGFLEPRIHDDLMMAVQSMEAQEANDISQVLARKQFSDGNNMLNSLHLGKLIRKVPVSQVSLTPLPNQQISLAEVNAEIRKLDSRSDNLKTNANPNSLEEQTRVTTENIEGTPANEGVEVADSPSIAQSLFTQGQLMIDDAKSLMADAESKLEEAYKLDPSLKPKRGRAKKV